jgi:ubiquinone/menaquinone biosynthesis C-methylase UbiE
MDVRTVFDNPWVFELSQRLVPFTVRAYEELARRHSEFNEGDRVLDIGCGVGWHRRLFRAQDYTGIDINPAYVARATRMYGRRFHVMDASRLEFPDGMFDGAVCIATLHHLSDDLARAMITEALRVVKPGGALHIIDPVLPIDPRAWLKRLLFENDRGRFQRDVSEMTRLVDEGGLVVRQDLRRGWLHDVAYFRLARRH